MKDSNSRESLLINAFSDIPSKVGELTLRRLSAASFTLLGMLENPMMVGKKQPLEAAADEVADKLTQAEQFDAVTQYIWVHSADLEEVVQIETADQLPLKDIRRLGFQISIGEAFAFLMKYQECSLRLAAALAEIEPEEDESRGKLQESPRAGSPPSSLPAVPPVTQPERDTSFGSCPSSEHSATSTPPTSLLEHAADGQSQLTVLPQLTPETTPQS